jgi:hypothetical protein
LAGFASATAPQNKSSHCQDRAMSAFEPADPMRT